MRPLATLILEWLLSRLKPAVAEKVSTEDRYTYRVAWDEAGQEYVATCEDFPSLSWLATSRHSAMEGLTILIREVRADMENQDEVAPGEGQERNHEANVSTEPAAVRPQPKPSPTPSSTARAARHSLSLFPGRARALAEIHRGHCCAIHGCLRPGSPCAVLAGLEPYFGCKKCEEKMVPGIAAS